MSCNVGLIDRTVRIVLGIALILAWALGWLGGGVAIALAVVGLVFVATAAVRFCPIYRVLGLTTCPTPTRPTP